MLERVKLFIKLAAEHPEGGRNTFLETFIFFLKDLMVSLPYAAQFSILDIGSSSKFIELDQSIKETMTILGLNAASTFYMEPTADPLQMAQEKFTALTTGNVILLKLVAIRNRHY